MYSITKSMKASVAAAGLYIPSCMLSVGADSKTVKGEKLGYVTGIMYLTPSVSRCPSSELAGCIKPCLNLAGRGVFNSVIKGRANKTALLEQFEEIAMIAIYKGIQRVIRKAERENMKPCIRLNGTSDLSWANYKLDGKTLFEHFPDVQFYDYTKVPSNVRKAEDIPNYHLTVSYSNASKFASVFNMLLGGNSNIAVVFRNGLPETYLGLPVIDGDDSDLRFLDYKVFDGRCIIGLKAKGKAKKDTGSFTVDTAVLNQNIIASAA